MSQVLTLRVDDDLMAVIERAAKVEGIAKSEIAVRVLGERLGPKIPGQIEGMEVFKLSVSEIACLDQLAERAGVTRVELLNRWTSQRLRREFVDDRNRLIQEALRPKARS